MKFSKTTGCFYPDFITYDPATLPSDLIEVTDAEHKAALNRTPEQILTVVSGQVVITEKPDASLTELKAVKSEKIKKMAKSAIESGLICTALGSAYTYPTTFDDQKKLTALVVKTLLPGSDDAYKVWCMNVDGKWKRRAHTKLQIQQVAQDISSHVDAQQTIYEKKLDDINAANSKDTLDSINWS